MTFLQSPFVEALKKKVSGTVVRSTLRAVPATVPDPFFFRGPKEALNRLLSPYVPITPGAAYGGFRDFFFGRNDHGRRP